MTPADPRYAPLFEPIEIGPKTMRNRFYQTPHASGLTGQRPGAEAYFRAIKIEGGWGAVSTGQTMISPEYDMSGHEYTSRIWDEADVPNWGLMCDRVHEAGGLAGIELGASGSGVTGYDTRLPSRSVSGIVDDMLWMGSTYVMTKDDIRDLQHEYVAAAKRALSAGFDIINVHGAEFWGMPSQFLVARYNRRTDEYGGSFENRARFWLETLELVREAVGDSCAITARHCIDTRDGRPDGIRVGEEGVGFIELADHLVDFWDLQVGGHDKGSWSLDVGPSRFFHENFQGEYFADIRRHTSKPIVGVGRFTSPDTMVGVINSGQLDIIGAARAAISDPFLPTKIFEGRLDEIRECIGCNVCVSRINTDSRIICTQNASAGEEYRRGWHPELVPPVADTKTSVLVVGAGPAGLECAITLARRGIEYVHLAERSRRIGGHFQWVPQLPGLIEWARLIDYRKAIAAKLSNLAVINNRPLDADAILDYGAQLIVLATGSHWATDGLNPVTQAPLPGAGRPHVFTPERLMVERAEVPGQQIVVYDCEGYFIGASLAELLAQQGKNVQLISPLSTVAPYLEYTGERALMIARLLGLGVTLHAGQAITHIESDHVRGHLREYPTRSFTAGAHAVVLVTQRVPNDELYLELRGRREEWATNGIRGVYRAGDCHAPRPQVADAIFDARRLAEEIDSPDPSKPLAWIREERFLGYDDADYDATLNGASRAVRPSSQTRAAV